MADEIYVQRRFVVAAANGYPEFRDALVLSQTDYDALSGAQITALKTARYAAFTAAIDAARNAPEPTNPQKIAAFKAAFVNFVREVLERADRRDVTIAKLQELGVDVSGSQLLTLLANNDIVITLTRLNKILTY